MTNRVCRESREGVTWGNRSLDGFELWTLWPWLLGLRGPEHECIKKSLIAFFSKTVLLLTSLKVMHQARSRHTYERHITFLHFSLWVSSNSCLFTATMGHGGVFFDLCASHDLQFHVCTLLWNHLIAWCCSFTQLHGVSARGCAPRTALCLLYFLIVPLFKQ